MTKTLTEQWRDGTLPDGYYYIDYDTQQRIFEIEDGCATYQGLPAETYFLNDICLIKVIAPVPNYEEWQSCEKCADMLINVNKKWEQTIKANKMYGRKLDIATKALKDIKVYSQRDWDEYNCMECADKALKEMEGVK